MPTAPMTAPAMRIDPGIRFGCSNSAEDSGTMMAKEIPVMTNDTGRSNSISFISRYLKKGTKLAWHRRPMDTQWECRISAAAFSEMKFSA
jgi:hypothetical protein